MEGSSGSIPEQQDFFTKSLSSVQTALNKKNIWEIDYTELHVYDTISLGQVGKMENGLSVFFFHNYLNSFPFFFVANIYKAQWRQQTVAFKCWLANVDSFVTEAPYLMSIRPHKHLVESNKLRIRFHWN